jgi:hypothetical protein
MTDNLVLAAQVEQMEYSQFAVVEVKQQDYMEVVLVEEVTVFLDILELMAQ